MRHKEARQQILNGVDIKQVHDKFIEEKVKPLNYKGIEFEDLRKDVEPKYTRLLAELDWCYYVFWQYGESCPFQEWDVQNSKENSFILFTTLSNSLYDQIAIDLHEENEKRGRQYEKLYKRNSIIGEGDRVSAIEKLKTKQRMQIRIE